MYVAARQVPTTRSYLIAGVAFVGAGVIAVSPMAPPVPNIHLPSIRAAEAQLAALASDTWGCEVRPNETKDANQPWHWVVIPAMGLCMGEIFYLKELAEDCAKDKIYEFFFCGPPLIITGGTGSPINPQAIK